MTDTAHETGRAPRAGLDARYGRSPAKRKRDRWIAISSGIAVAAVVGAWVIWAGLDMAGGGIDATDIGHKVIDDRSVSVNYQVSMAPGSTAACALQVQNEAHGIVGWRIVKIPASKLETRAFSDTVRSSELGVTGLIYRCWLT
ncbi:DUF4307 domain-containing protein [Parafrigoribacterium soli]|uniref:DUF4307 domain-containing protein n=1 Tax=Parafrigoribacterium soli TaxID=3144663 RepID=UPI0032EEFE94